MDKNKVETREVWSANWWYLFFGIIFVLIIIMLEGCVIREFLIKPFREAIGLAVILQLPCLLCLLFTQMIKMWKERTKFNLYYCKLETGTDIDYIKENYSVKDISPRGILFVEKEDTYNFSTWKLLQGYEYMFQVEEKLFGQ